MPYFLPKELWGGLTGITPGLQALATGMGNWWNPEAFSGREQIYDWNRWWDGVMGQWLPTAPGAMKRMYPQMYYDPENPYTYSRAPMKGHKPVEGTAANMWPNAEDPRKKKILEFVSQLKLALPTMSEEQKKSYSGIIQFLELLASEKGYAAGGKVGQDTIPALLSPGEYVLNPNAVKSFGKENLDTLNFQVAPSSNRRTSRMGFAPGGEVPLVDYTKLSNQQKDELARKAIIAKYGNIDQINDFIVQGWHRREGVQDPVRAFDEWKTNLDKYTAERQARTQADPVNALDPNGLEHPVSPIISLNSAMLGQNGVKGFNVPPDFDFRQPSGAAKPMKNDVEISSEQVTPPEIFDGMVTPPSAQQAPIPLAEPTLPPPAPPATLPPRAPFIGLRDFGQGPNIDWGAMSKMAPEEAMTLLSKYAATQAIAPRLTWNNPLGRQGVAMESLLGQYKGAMEPMKTAADISYNKALARESTGRAVQQESLNAINSQLDSQNIRLNAAVGEYNTQQADLAAKNLQNELSRKLALLGLDVKSVDADIKQKLALAGYYDRMPGATGSESASLFGGVASADAARMWESYNKEADNKRAEVNALMARKGKAGWSEVDDRNLALATAYLYIVNSPTVLLEEPLTAVAAIKSYLQTYQVLGKRGKQFISDDEIISALATMQNNFAVRQWILLMAATNPMFQQIYGKTTNTTPGSATKKAVEDLFKE